MKIICLSCFLVCSLLITSAQTRFDRVDSIPVTVGGHTLQSAWAGGLNNPLISEIDLNGDGVHDMFVFDRFNNRIETFLNDGDTSINAWHYAPQYENQFPVLNKWALLYDYDCDGKADVFTLSSLYPSGIAVYRNNTPPGLGVPLQWTLVTNFLMEHFSTILTNIFASGVSIPAFNDVDCDGDMDILGYNSVPDGRLVWHKNYSMEHYGNCDSLDFTYDTGCWGNFVLTIGGANAVSCFHCPCRERGPGKEAEMQFDPSDLVQYDQSTAARRDDTISSVFIIDIDGDGVMDLLMGDVSADNTLMIHNGGTCGVAEMDAQDTQFPSANVPALFNGFHYHGYLDLDNDGKKDLLVCAGENENLHGVWWYKDASATNVPDFQFQGTAFLQEEMIEVGETAAPVLFDYDGDGLKDLIIAGSVFQSGSASFTSSIYYYRNSGTSTNPSFDLITNDMSSISALGYVPPIYPAFGDLDGDCDEDLLLGTSDGKIQYFNNAGACGNPANFLLAVPDYRGIDVGNDATPQLIDIDRDQLLDLVVGQHNGFVYYYKNTGTSSSPFFTSGPSDDSLGCIDRHVSGFTNGFAVPFAYDSLGNYRMLVANMAGNIFEYSNIDGNLGGCFTITDSLYNRPPTSRIKFNVTVSGGDLNGDGLTDLVVGQSSGGVLVYYQRNPNFAVQEVSIPQPSMVMFPNPANDRIQVQFYHIPKDHLAIIKVLDCQGKSVLTETLKENKKVFDTSRLAQGLYLIQLEVSGRTVSGKFSVRH